MSADPSLWVDVRISASQTEALVHELLASASAVEASLAMLSSDALSHGDWGGPHRVAFDAEREALVRAGADLAAALAASAHEAAVLLAAGEGEQRLRRAVRHQVEIASRPVGAS